MRSFTPYLRRCLGLLYLGYLGMAFPNEMALVDFQSNRNPFHDSDETLGLLLFYMYLGLVVWAGRKQGLGSI